MIYYYLLAPRDKGTIVRTNGRNHEQYIKEKGWIRSGILLEYFWPESDIFERYEIISEKEALKRIQEVS